MQVEIKESVIKKMRIVAKEQDYPCETKEDIEKFIERLVDFHL